MTQKAGGTGSQEIKTKVGLRVHTLIINHNAHSDVTL